MSDDDIDKYLEYIEKQEDAIERDKNDIAERRRIIRTYFTRIVQAIDNGSGSGDPLKDACLRFQNDWEVYYRCLNRLQQQLNRNRGQMILVNYKQPFGSDWIRPNATLPDGAGRYSMLGLIDELGTLSLDRNLLELPVSKYFVCGDHNVPESAALTIDLRWMIAIENIMDMSSLVIGDAEVANLWPRTTGFGSRRVRDEETLRTLHKLLLAPRTKENPYFPLV